MKNRSFKRVRFASQAMVITDDNRFEASTENLCLNGLFIRTDHLIPVGKLVAISLKLPSASRTSTVTVDGVVVRNSPEGVAFKFKSLDVDTFAHLKSVINRKPLICH